MSDESEVKLRHLTAADWDALRSVHDKAYHGSGLDNWESSEITRLLEIFPEGQLCIEINGKPVASALTLIVNYDTFTKSHTHEDVLQLLHNPDTKKGDALYGIEIFVHPEFRGLRLGRRLYDARKELCENLNLRAILTGGRIPQYSDHSGELSPKEYIEKVRHRDIHDPVLSFQLSNDFSAKKVLKGYLPDDSESEKFAILLEWTNIYYDAQPSLINNPRSVVRLGLVQWQMRSVSGIDELIDLMEFFVDSVSSYHADFLLFPEFFNAALMAPYNELPTPTAFRLLAQFTEPLLEKFKTFAVSYNVNIITGSMPLLKGDTLYNVSHLCRRDGSIESQSKIHITPSEVQYWGITGGDSLKVFDTDCGRIAIQICYDVEFPELSRHCAAQGVEILFVPFLTDTQNGYLRVRRCAQARAIENECYVAIAGSVGNLPKVHNMDIHYAQSAVFSPSDFAFPVDAVVSEATPNTEMTVIADINLDLLKELHVQGSVRNLQDRRTDLYSLQWKTE